MKKNIIRIIAALPGLPMLLNGVGFLLQPEQAAASLGMEMLEGVGRSTQVGDFASFFFGLAVLIFLGAYHSKGRWLYAGAMFLGSAAVFRMVAAVAHGADMATQFIAVEVILTVWLCVCAFLLDREAG
jgi:hypothetical protein